MELQDIIRTDNDRLFIVDPECFILFTGTSLDDDKPFIRIGTWMNMPVELIPLIENIVIPDAITGNPSGEQFNIDIKNLAVNRYIGSRDVVHRYLEFQKIFGLDLLSANVVDVETDIPELSKERNLSERNQFIGVFYRDGNFKTVHGSSTILDLNDLRRSCKNYNDLHDDVSSSALKNADYSGNGLVIIGHNPLFYSDGRFTSYLFPLRYLDVFTRLGIDPGKINEIIHPSMTILNLTRYLKWRDKNGHPLSLITDHDILVQRLRRLLPSLRIRQVKFDSLDFVTGGKATIRRYDGTYNIKIMYPESVSIAYCKSATGLKQVIQDKPDALLVAYSVFEDTAMMLRSSPVPFAVIDDGNKNISKIHDASVTILHPGIRYEFRSYMNINDIFSDLCLPSDLLLPAQETQDWIDSFERRLAQSDPAFQYNGTALLALFMHTTTDRKAASRCRELLTRLQKASASLPMDGYTAIIILYKEALFLGYVTTGHDVPSPLFDDVNAGDRHLYEFTPNGPFYNRILADRERLSQLLALFTGSEKFRSEHDESVRHLQREIDRRKSLSMSTDIIEEDQYRRVMLRGKEMPPFTDGGEAENGRDEPVTGERPTQESGKRRLKLIGIAAAIAAILVVLSLAAIRHSGILDEGTKAENPLERKLTVKERTFYEKKYDIVINNSDIFTYANRIAAMNGYNPIPYQTMRKGKNPDWIYPKNVFQMTDGETVIVKAGDTLWDLSRDKLVRMTVLFKESIEQSKGLTGMERSKILARAKSYAFTKEQSDTVDSLIGTAAVDNEKGH